MSIGKKFRVKVGVRVKNLLREEKTGSGLKATVVDLSPIGVRGSTVSKSVVIETCPRPVRGHNRE